MDFLPLLQPLLVTAKVIEWHFPKYFGHTKRQTFSILQKALGHY
jgi:hypothetical protein